MMTMEVIALHLKLVQGVWGVPLAYVVRQHVKVMHVSPGYDFDLNFDKGIIAKDPTVDDKSNLKMTQDSLNRAYVSWHYNTFKIDNASMYCILVKIFMDMDTYVYMTDTEYTGWPSFIL